MAIPTRLMGAGLAALAATEVCGSVADSLTATGSTNADALQLSAVINRVTTAAASTGVRLMLPEPGSAVVVVNSGANALTVYPGTGAAINALTATTGGSPLRLVGVRCLSGHHRQTGLRSCRRKRRGFGPVFMPLAGVISR